MNLGKRIKRLREEKKISRVKFCKGIISPSHFSNIENNRYTPSNDMISLLAKKLSVPENYFLNVHEDDEELQILLEKLENQVEEENIGLIDKLLHDNKEVFSFIPSIKQEFHFSLLTFLFLIKSNRSEDAIKFYLKKISKMEFNLHSNHPLKEKHYQVLGLYFFYINEYKKSIFYFKKVIETKDIPLLKAEVSFYIARSLFFMYHYHEALKYLKISKDIYLQIHNWEKTCYCYDLLALLYREIGMLVKSEEYIMKGFDIVNKQSEILQSNLYYDLALINKDFGDYSKALIYIQRSIELKEQNKADDIYLSHHLRLSVFLLKQDLISLKKNLPIALKLVKTTKDKGTYLFIQAKLHYLLEEFTLYESNIEECITIFNTEKDWKNANFAAEHYANYLEENNKYKKALEYYKSSKFAFKIMHQNSV